MTEKMHGCFHVRFTNKNNVCILKIFIACERTKPIVSSHFYFFKFHVVLAKI